MKTLNKIVITTFLVVMSMQLNAMDQTEYNMNQILESLRLSDIKREQEDIEKRKRLGIRANREDKRSLKKLSGVATIENLVGKPLYEQQNILNALSNNVKAYL